MKTFQSALLGLTVCCLFLLSSCEKDAELVKEGYSLVEFSFVLPESENAKKTSSEDIWGNGVEITEVADCDEVEVDYLRITVRPKGAQDDSEDITEELKVFKKEGKIFTSEALQLMNDTAYDILSFVIYNDQEQAVLATPLIGSMFENFVYTPIGVGAETCIPADRDRKTYLGLEVLCCEAFDPPNFGYVYFYTKIVNMRTLCVQVKKCVEYNDDEDDKKTGDYYSRDKYYCPEFKVLMWYAYKDSSGEWKKGKAIYDRENAPYRSKDDECALCFKYPDRERQQFYYIKLVGHDHEVYFEGVASDEHLEELMEDEGRITIKLECDDKDDCHGEKETAWASSCPVDKDDDKKTRPKHSCEYNLSDLRKSSNWGWYICYEMDDDKQSYPIYAGQHTPAGMLHIKYKEDKNYLELKVDGDDEALYSLLHLYVGSGKDFPQGNGNMKHKGWQVPDVEADPFEKHTYKLYLPDDEDMYYRYDDDEDDRKVIIALHAESYTNCEGKDDSKDDDNEHKGGDHLLWLWKLLNHWNDD